MSVLFSFLILPLTFYINLTYGYYSPSVAFHDNLPAMYKTNNGWVVNGNSKQKITNHTEIVFFCQEIYPTYNIVNAIIQFKKERITNWCQVNQSCTLKDQYDVHPIECINNSYVYKSMSIPSYCKFNIDQTDECFPFNKWKKRAENYCNQVDEDLHDLQSIFPCKNEYMMFSEAEFICCSDKDEVSQYSIGLRTKLDGLLKKYRPSLDKYQYNNESHIEHKLFSKTKGALIQKYLSSLMFLNKELKGNLKKIMKENSLMTTQTYKTDESQLFKTYKHNYESITHDFRRGLLHLDGIHIKRIIRKSDSVCHTKNKSVNNLSKCLRELNVINKKIVEHFKRMIHIQGVDSTEYLAFVESRMKHLHSRYLPLVRGDKVWSKKFDDQMKKYRLKLESNHMFGIKGLDHIIKRKFDHYKREAIEFLHYREHYLSLAPMVGIIAIVIFAFIIVISILFYKYWSTHYRRGTHNYVMRVVGEPDLSSQSINRPEMKLNLYENPIFNSKSLSKPIEKRSLIENMEN